MKNFSKLTASLMIGGALILGACNNSEKPKMGIEFKSDGNSKGKTPGDSSVVEFHIIQKTEKDSTFFDSKDPKVNPSGQPFADKLNSGRSPKALIYMMKQLHEGETGTFTISSDSLLAGQNVQKEQLPPALASGRKVKITISLVKIYTEKEYTDLMTSKRNKMIEENKKSIEAYLAKNNITATGTPSGLFYLIDKPGKGDNVKGTDKVKVNYEGRLLDGKLFDTNEEGVAKKEGIFQQGRPYQPFEVTVGSRMVIPGWEEGLTYFNKGAKGRLFIPAHLAYGIDGMPPTIPGNSALIFDVEILDIKKGDAMPPQMQMQQPQAPPVK